MRIRYHKSSLVRLLLALGFVALVGSTYACSSRSWKRLSVKTMQEALVEMSIAEAHFAERGTPDSLRWLAYNTLLKRYDATLEDWDSSLVWYSSKDLESYKDIYDAAYKQLEQRKSLLQLRNDSITKIQTAQWRWRAGDVDSVNLLRDSASFHSSRSYIERSIRYSPDQSYSAGTRLVLVMRSTGYKAKALQSPLNLRLRLFFSDSTQLSRTVIVKAAGLARIELLVPEGKTMRTAFAQLWGHAPRLDKGQFLAVDSFALVRYSSVAGAIPPPPPPSASNTELRNDTESDIPPPTTADTGTDF